MTRHAVPKGATFSLRTGGGGGYGPPSERDPDAVHADVREGYVTETAARRDYPHAFDQQHPVSHNGGASIPRQEGSGHVSEVELPARLRGEVAVVTGAGGGIGGAVAQRLAAEGAAVVVDDIHEEAVESTVAAIRAAGGEATGVVADVGRADEVDALFDRAVEAFDTVTILVNNAGLIGQTCHFLDADEGWWDRLLTTNLKSVFLCSHRAAQIMSRHGGGAIVSSSSGGATKAHRGEAAYDASKGGIEALTRAMALDLAPYGSVRTPSRPAPSTSRRSGRRRRRFWRAAVRRSHSAASADPRT